MLNLPPLKFNALDTSGKNYLMWARDAELYLTSKGLGETIRDGNNAYSQDKAKALMLLWHHLSEELKDVYSFMEIRDPLALWNSLKNKGRNVTRKLLCS
ncbi:hypothetical protein LIER_42654 [Lithospermum erythrorhizon]|uniref:Retrotransposon Copia-like N-terminal domain-containing protein n=1 Tax=Lithospermum erythrorhizon TaxID=34254 RepID=A0AAV3NPV1_LITER